MDGESAVQFLLKQEEYKDAPRPDLILLDLNLPKKDGREVLNIIKQDKNLKPIPVAPISEEPGDSTASDRHHERVDTNDPIHLKFERA